MRKRTPVVPPISAAALLDTNLEETYSDLTPEQLDWIRQEQVVVTPGRKPTKPVMRWAPGNTLGHRPGALAPGSGAGLNHIDAANSRKSAIKRTDEYIALTQRILDAGDGGGYEEVIMATRDSAVGTTKEITATCPECEHKFTVEMKFPGDPRSQKILIEAMQGSPLRRTEADVNMHVTQQDLSVLVELTPEQMASIFRPGLTQDEINDRRDYIDVRSEDIR